jgi:ribosome-associated protein
MNKPQSDASIIRLDDLLKLAGVVDSGGQAKMLVQGGDVAVNGEVDTRRGRKLVSGDRVTVAGRTIDVDATLNAKGKSATKRKESGAPERRALTPFDRPDPRPKVAPVPKPAKGRKPQRTERLGKPAVARDSGRAPRRGR